MISIVEGRVLGALLEKERTTPDQYPLTLNALVLACNQSTSRDPVMKLQEHEVESALASLKAQGLLRFVHPSHGRSVTRYRQVADEAWALPGGAAAVLGLLLLRGPQTVQELVTRAERWHRFDGPPAAEQSLRELAASGRARLLERLPGQRDPRWQQIVAEEAEVDRTAQPAPVAGSTADRLAQLEERVAKLEAALGELLE